MYSESHPAEPFRSGLAVDEQDSELCVQNSDVTGAKLLSRRSELRVVLLTGGQDRHYAFGLANALFANGVYLDLVGGDSEDSPEMHATPRIRFLNFHGNTEDKSIGGRIKTVLGSYARLMWYAANSKPKIFHILWNNKVQLVDRTLLMLYYKLLGKKIVLTAHNVNAGRRDSRDSLINRLTLKIQYGLADHVFVHTKKMKDELVERFQVAEPAVTIIPFGINNAVPNTGLTSAEAKKQLGIREWERTLLFFGAIKQYKGLEYLVAAFQQIAEHNGNYRLIIAGERKKGSEEYLSAIQQTIVQHSSRRQVIQRIEFIPDDETELYFKAADVAVLPYTEIFQSGILFLAYSFGLPVIASDVGSFREDVIEGRTGSVCEPRDVGALAVAIHRYFDSDLYMELNQRRQEIRDYALSSHSWETVGDLTMNVYKGLLAP